MDRRHTMYWLTLDGDRFGLILHVNDLPAARLPSSAGRRMPINEYLVRGLNRVRVERGPSFQDEHQGQTRGVLTLTILEADFEGGEMRDSRELVKQSYPYDPDVQPVGSTLADATFQSRLGSLPDLGGFEPLDRENGGLIVEQMGRVAGWWRARQFEPIAHWMDGYFRAYADAYASETQDSIRAKFLRMAERLTQPGFQVRFNPATTRLDPCAGGRLADVLNLEQGAAVQVVSPEDHVYDFWTVAGVRAGQAVLVR